MGFGDLLLKPLRNVPVVKEGDDLARLALAALGQSDAQLSEGDVLVFAQKIVSKAEGRSVALDAVTPSPRALALAKETGKDARLVELILSESTDIVRQRKDLLIVRHRLGFTLANAGIDASNVEGEGRVLLLPADPDASAARIRARRCTRAPASIAPS